MRFVVVSDRMPFGHQYCALCTATLEDGYLRELGTAILYCGFGCYTEHCEAAIMALNRRVLLPVYSRPP